MRTATSELSSLGPLPNTASAAKPPRHNGAHGKHGVDGHNLQLLWASSWEIMTWYRLGLYGDMEGWRIRDGDSAKGQLFNLRRSEMQISSGALGSVLQGNLKAPGAGERELRSQGAMFFVELRRTRNEIGIAIALRLFEQDT